ncbi:hypothetical protein BACOVA_00632 [Bacteroides ovatus ATCC 8483]|uniref:Uncharacterized protein n=1 Tax=Bacteroides ovatus (strain ATCC 8483 / DSM 1896 / JCM 5824 / BCRC 10623 / CCUG 4943 / NCTC 11153) TaxID=411476 RepID=A0AAN3ABW8_BACO1|nr:hypothetical protein BACOVA_00632 [Bacteroides ovatus ATCC 8483]
MGLSRNKVAVPEGAAGTPPFWSDVVNCHKRGSNLKTLKVLFFVLLVLVYL